jgi:hypothetical protein
MSYASHTPEQVVSLGEEIYDRHIRPHLDSQSHGKFVVIDVATGSYEVDGDDLQATKRLLVNCPNAVMYGVRVGYPTAYTLGGHMELKHG